MYKWPRGATDNASAYGAEDCRFESCRGRLIFFYHMYTVLLYAEIKYNFVEV